MQRPMRWLLLFVWVLTPACATSGRSFNPLWRVTQTPADRARELAPQCAGSSDELTARVLSPSMVESVEPGYSRVVAANGGEFLSGAKLHIRPEVNVTPELLERTLQCHQARVTLDDTGEIPYDPYVLYGVWLDIRVDSTGSGLVAQVITDKADIAHKVLDRAQTFAAYRP